MCVNTHVFTNDGTSGEAWPLMKVVHLGVSQSTGQEPASLLSSLYMEQQTGQDVFRQACNPKKNPHLIFTNAYYIEGLIGTCIW